jgi:hypothetical protein
MATTTFVFVTPRRWPKKTDWAAKKRAEGKWRDVLALDGDDIEQALDEAPAIHFWFSEALGMHTAAVQTLEAWWDGFSSAYEPTLTPRMVLAGRANEAAALLRLLARDVGRALVRAASVDDGLAFVGSVMLSADPDASAAMFSKSLLVHDGASLRRLDNTSSLLILLPVRGTAAAGGRPCSDHPAAQRPPGDHRPGHRRRWTATAEHLLESTPALRRQRIPGKGAEGLGDRNAAIRCACDRRTAGWRRTRWGLPGRLRRRR